MTEIRLTYQLYHQWHTDKNISVIGSAFLDNVLLKEQNLIYYFSTVGNETSFAEKLKKLTGHFAVIISKENKIFSAVDLIRTFPLFIHQKENNVIITDSIPAENDWDEKEMENFKNVYCAQENNTLLINWKQLQVGEYTVIDEANSTFEIKAWYHHTGKSNSPPDKKKLEQLESKLVDRTIQYANNRTILVPLSGGYDSRYILALLKEKNYPKLECFTYGRKESHEVLIAKNVAEKLNVKWHFIEYTDELLNSFFSETWEKYSNLNHNYSSLPHEQDFFALLYLKQQNLLPDDAVVINGFCQDIHAGSFIEPIKNFDLKKFLLYKYGIKPDLASYDNSWNGYQEWLVKNRLSKFIVNSVRVYEYFGLDFYLPFWQQDWINFWYELDIEYRTDQKLYADYLLHGIFKKLHINFKKPGFHSFASLYSLKKLAKSILPKQITQQIQQQNSKDKQNDPNNTLFLYESIYERLKDKPENKDFLVNHIHVLYFLEKLKENDQL
ncbi:MAG: hypothetical protein JWN78_2415 [Bacteroidota bacterium]|nr:hypothetical protein [Bacteroidota bacterium]